MVVDKIWLETMVKRANDAGLRGKQPVALEYISARTGHELDSYVYTFSDGSEERW